MFRKLLYYSKSSVFLLLLVIPFFVRSQVRFLENPNTQIWLQYFANVEWKKKYSLQADIGYRFEKDWRHCTSDLFRIGAYAKIFKNTKIGLGIAHFDYYVGTQCFRKETRPFQDFLYETERDKLSFAHRLRFEEQFFENMYDRHFAYRVRYQFLLKYTFLTWDRDKKSISLVHSDELFYTNNERESINGLSNLRMDTGLLFQLNPSLKFHCSYNSQFQHNQFGKELIHSNVVWFSVKNTISRKLRGQNKVTKRWIRN